MEHMPEEVEDGSTPEDRSNMPFCAVCGDVKACLHKPDAVVRAAWDNEVKIAHDRNVWKEGRHK